MPLYPEHIEPMIATWRTLAEHYRRTGDRTGAARTTRLADQMSAMVRNGRIRYSPPSLTAEPAREIARQCNKCQHVLPISQFPKNPITQGYARQCRQCHLASLPPSRQKRGKKPAIMPIDPTLSK